jgi:hypothetical protein
MVQRSLDWASLAMFVSFARLGSFDILLFMFGAWLGLILLGIHDVSLGFSLRSQFAGQEPISISLHLFIFLQLRP